MIRLTLLTYCLEPFRLPLDDNTTVMLKKKLLLTAAFLLLPVPARALLEQLRRKTQQKQSPQAHSPSAFLKGD